MRAEKWDCRYDPDTYHRLKRLDDMGFVLPTVINGDRRLVRIQELFGDEDHSGGTKEVVQHERLRRDYRGRQKLCRVIRCCI